MNDVMTNIPALSRRRLLASAAVVGAGLVAAACGSDTVKSATSSAPSGGPTTVGGAADTTPAGTTPADTTAAGTTPADTTAAGTTPADTAAAGTTAADASVDLKVAGLAASLEVLAVGTYKAALDAATAGSLGAVPPAVGEFVTVAMAQHQKQLDAWNGVITGAGGSAVTEPNATLKPVVDAAFAKVTDVAGAAKLALLLEETAAATYLSAQKVLTLPDAIQLAGSIQIIDAQHAAVLHFVLGEYPVPDTFAKVDLAAAA